MANDDVFCLLGVTHVQGNRFMLIALRAGRHFNIDYYASSAGEQAMLNAMAERPPYHKMVIRSTDGKLVQIPGDGRTTCQCGVVY